MSSNWAAAEAAAAQFDAKASFAEYLVKREQALKVPEGTLRQIIEDEGALAVADPAKALETIRERRAKVGIKISEEGLIQQRDGVLIAYRRFFLGEPSYGSERAAAIVASNELPASSNHYARIVHFLDSGNSSSLVGAMRVNPQLVIFTAKLDNPGFLTLCRKFAGSLVEEPLHVVGSPTTRAAESPCQATVDLLSKAVERNMRDAAEVLVLVYPLTVGMPGMTPSARNAKSVTELCRKMSLLDRLIFSLMAAGQQNIVGDMYNDRILSAEEVTRSRELIGLTP